MKSFIAMMFLVLSAVSQATTNHGGFVIEASAEAIYYNDALGAIETKVSNVVSIVIAQVYNFKLTPVDITLEKYRGDEVLLTHELINMGNTIVNINLSFENSLASNGFDLIDVKHYLDLNKNLIIDEGDVELFAEQKNTSGFTVDQSKIILTRARVPSLVEFGAISSLKVIASIPLEKTVESVDSVEVLAEPELLISASANRQNAQPKDVVVLNFITNNIAPIDALPKKIMLDSAPRDFVVVRGYMPANTTFQSKESSRGAVFAYHLVGTPDDTYTTIQPSNSALIDSVVFLYDAIVGGAQLSGAYSVVINDNASDFVTGYFTVVYTKDTVIEKEKQSNEFTVLLPEVPAEFEIFNDGFLGIAQVVRSGNTLNIRADVASCNVDPALREVYSVTISALKSGDRDGTFSVIETGANTGIFQAELIPTVNAKEHPVQIDNALLEVVRKDEITVSLSCHGIDLASKVLIDPLGIVFNSLTNEPVANVTIALMGVDNAGAFFVPEVFDVEQRPISNVQKTDENGLYWFPLIYKGAYVLQVRDLEYYVAPSKLPQEKLDVAREIDRRGSYGETFEVTGEIPLITIDIPIDPILNNNLLIQKVANKDTVEIGDVIEYTLTLVNLSAQGIASVTIEDVMPLGFQLLGVEGFDYEQEQNVFTINLPTLMAGEELEIQYKALVKMSAKNGDGVNTVRAYGGLYESNIASVKVDVVDDSVFENPLIMGKVYKDCNNNSTKDIDDFGIPNVRVYLDNGYYAITDKKGNYKIYNLSARTYAVRLDKSTLPLPYKFSTVSTKNANDPFSLFADLRFGELHRSDFRDIDCSEEGLAVLRTRMRSIDGIRTEVERSAERDLNFNDRVKNDLKSENAEGIIGERKEALTSLYVTEKSQGLPHNDLIVIEAIAINADEELTDDYNQDLYVTKEVEQGVVNTIMKQAVAVKSIATTVDLAKLAGLRLFNNELDFLDIIDNDILKQNQVSIRLKGTAQASLQLWVNNNLIEIDKIGQSMVFKEKDLQMLEYVSVQLSSGINLLEIRQLDGFGNMRADKVIKVLASGDLNKISIDLPEENKIVANPREPVWVGVNLLDKNNIPVAGKYTITLNSSIGVWQVEDINEKEKGIQALVEDGVAQFKLLPPDSAQSGILAFRVNDISLKEKVLATTYLRDMFAVGVVDGMFNFADRGLSDNIVTTGLEEAFSNLSMGNNQSGRVTLFLKGKIKGKYLLTFAYDTNKGSKDKLFADIEPEEFYPIYGDSSINGFEAQSTSKLFVKIEHGSSYVLYGDLNTRDSLNKTISLGNYNRTLTGLKHVVEDNQYRLSYYAAQESASARVKELVGKGSFGAYDFAAGEKVVPHSEKISLITRDKITGAVVDEKIMIRFYDYEISGFYDGVIFKEVVPVTDKDLNDVYVRIAYEVEGDNEEYLVYGLSGSYDVSRSLKVGFDYNHSEQKDAEFNISSVNIGYDAGSTSAKLELAQSDNLGTKGLAAHFYGKYNRNGHLIEVRSQVADDDFANEYSAVKNISHETTIRTRSKIADGLNVKAAIYLTENDSVSKRNRSMKASLEKNIDKNLKLESGVRVTKTEILGSSQESTMGSARVAWKPSFYDKVNTYYEYEQDIDISEINRQEFGVEHTLGTSGDVYLRHEVLSNLVSEIELSNVTSKSAKTVLGVDYAVSDNTDIYSEYRIDDVIVGKEAEAVIGARNKFIINDQWRGTIALERVESIEGEKQSSSSLSTAFQHTVSKDYKTVYRFQYRDTSVGNLYIGSVGYIRKLNENFSLLLKDTMSYEDDDSSIKNRFFSGVAYRDNEFNKLNMLLKYENQYDDGDDLTMTNELATQFNYRFNPQHELSGLYSIKHVKNEQEDVSYLANWVSGRYGYYYNEKINFGLSAAYLYDNETTKNYVLGAEAGYLIDDNFWLTLGYNFEGLQDNKYTKERFSSEGFYVRFRFKLSEEHFKWLQ
jgi:uncharacterized repeat protein (TIGR01451 family)